MKTTTTITINGKRYTLSWASFHDRVQVTGPGLLIGICLPAGVMMDDPREVLRKHAIQAVAQAKENRKKASDYIQQRVREGRA